MDTEHPSASNDDQALNLSGLLEVISSLRNSLAPFISRFAAFSEEASRIDWQDALRSWNSTIQERAKATRAIAEKGWTIPSWITSAEFEFLSTLNDKEIDHFFADAYRNDNFSRLNDVLQRLSLEPSLTDWHPLLADISPSIVAGLYRVTIPALLTVLEGFAVRKILKLTGQDSKKSNLAKLFEEANLHNKSGLEALPWISNLVFMQHLFAASDFTADQPSMLNRHWVLHGRSQHDWILADALRLITALDTLSWAGNF